MSELFPRSAYFDGDRLLALGGLAVAELADVYGTPLWILDAEELLARVHAYRDAFADGIVAYASKALCVTGLLQLLVEEGLWVDVASGGELATALNGDVPGERLILHGNNKSERELTSALRAGVARVVVDSFDELDRLALLAERPVDVLLRLNPGLEVATHTHLATGSEESKFGFSIARGLATRALERAAAARSLRLRGIHVHVGSMIRDVSDVVAAVDALGDFARSHDLQPEEVDVGGGLAIAATPDEAILEIDEYASAVRAAVSRAFPHAPRVIVEPGRSIVGPAGVTLYRVGTVKASPGGRTFVAVDGGMSDNPRPALYGARYTAVLAGPGRSAAPTPITVVGKHCESGDVLIDSTVVGLPVTGDLLAVPATGAYTQAMASNYNRLPRPALVLVGDGRADLLVRRETDFDLLRLDVPLRRAGGSDGVVPTA